MTNLSKLLELLASIILQSQTKQELEPDREPSISVANLIRRLRQLGVAVAESTTLEAYGLAQRLAVALVESQTMSMDQLMALVPIEAATSLSTTTSKGRKSRWERSTVSTKSNTRFGPKEDKPYNPLPFVDLPPGLTPLQIDQFLREQRLEELTLKLEKGELEFGDPDIRPPSPPPAYDRNGTRTNMRETRVRNAMLSEHQRLVEYMAKNIPGFIPPNDFKPVKKIRRIIIPQEKYPEYNFMGLIIGPRGCNHKRLESESGAQISIRGRGTQKEGKKTDHQTEEEAAMPQHIHIAADTEESLDKAVALIEPLLNPFHPAHEEFKKKGLEQLALVNGVSLTKIDSRCTVCGAVGHLMLRCNCCLYTICRDYCSGWECPDADYQSFQKANVKCGLCGDKGHVTMDCKLAKDLSSEQLAEIEKKTQGVIHGGPQHFGGGGGAKGHTLTIPPPPPPPPPPQRCVDAQQLDMEFSQMMSEISRGKEPSSTDPFLVPSGLPVGKSTQHTFPPPLVKANTNTNNSNNTGSSTAPMVLAPPILATTSDPQYSAGMLGAQQPHTTHLPSTTAPQGFGSQNHAGVGYGTESYTFPVNQQLSSTANGDASKVPINSAADPTGHDAPAAASSLGLNAVDGSSSAVPWNNEAFPVSCSTTDVDAAAAAQMYLPQNGFSGTGNALPVNGYYPAFQAAAPTPYMMDPMAQWTQQMTQMMAYYPNMFPGMFGYASSNAAGYAAPQQVQARQQVQPTRPSATGGTVSVMRSSESTSSVTGVAHARTVRSGGPSAASSIFSLNAHNVPVPPKDSAEAAAPLPPPPPED